LLIINCFSPFLNSTGTWGANVYSTILQSDAGAYIIECNNYGAANICSTNNWEAFVIRGTNYSSPNGGINYSVPNIIISADECSGANGWTTNSWRTNYSESHIRCIIGRTISSTYDEETNTLSNNVAVKWAIYLSWSHGLALTIFCTKYIISTHAGSNSKSDTSANTTSIHIVYAYGGNRYANIFFTNNIYPFT
jgi:hypothetical protein